MKKGMDKIENQRENWYKLLQKSQMTDLCDKIDQIMSGTDCDSDKQIFSAERESQ